MATVFAVSADHSVTVVAERDNTIVSATGDVSDSEGKGVERRRLSVGEAIDLHGEGRVIVSHGPAPEKPAPKKAPVKKAKVKK